MTPREYAENVRDRCLHSRKKCICVRYPSLSSVAMTVRVCADCSRQGRRLDLPSDGWSKMNPHLLTYVKRVLHVPVVQVIEYDVDVYMVPNWLNNFLSLGTDIRRTVGKESRPWSWPKVLERAVRDKEFRDCLEVQLMMGVPTNSVAQWIRSKGPWL